MVIVVVIEVIILIDYSFLCNRKWLWSWHTLWLVVLIDSSNESENNECFDDVIELKWPDHTSAQTSLHKT